MRSEFDQLYDRVSNWGRWGSDDELGTLNLVTPQVAAHAASLVRTGASVSCSRPVGQRPVLRPNDNLVHLMTRSGSDNSDVGVGSSADWIALGLHGYSYTHLDAHSHMFWNGRMYNDRPKELVTTERGALTGGVEPTFAGIITRGVLLDFPALHGQDRLPDGHVITVAEFDDAVAMAGVHLGPGDAVFVRTGWGEDPEDIQSTPTSGLAGDCVLRLREADVAVMVADGVHEAVPSTVAGCDTPIHVLTLVAMGMWLVDNAALKGLSEMSRAEERFEFMTLFAPIPFRRSTGSLVNPIAVF
jgi:hypothetical protein